MNSSSRSPFPTVRERAALFLTLGIALAGLAGCGAGVERRPEPKRQPLLAWPAAPEKPRFVYEDALRHSNSIAPAAEDALRRAVGGASDQSPVPLKKPFGVAAHKGRIYVTDTEAESVYVFDVPRRRFFSFGYRQQGKLTRPAGISVDSQGAVYVADVKGRRAVRYDAYGLYLNSYGGKAELDRPSAVAADAEAGRVYVVDTGGVESERHRVVVFDMQGRMTGTIGRRGSQEGEFNLPVDAAVAPDGTLYVLDAGNFRVQAFDREGRYLRRFGSVGSAPGQFARPRAIGVDRSGNVYVSDAAFSNFQVFSPAGELLLAIGGRGEADQPGRYGLIAGVTIDETSRVYVVDQYFGKVEVFRYVGD